MRGAIGISAGDNADHGHRRGGFHRFGGLPGIVGEYGVTVLNVDKLTYAANPASLRPVETSRRDYFFRQADICDGAAITALFAEFDPEAVLHLAAETHVDRSIDGPAAFIQTNVVGTFTLLDAALDLLAIVSAERGRRGSAFCIFRPTRSSARSAPGQFTEATRYEPNSPYSASKAASDIWFALGTRHTDADDAAIVRTITALSIFPKS